VQVRRICVIDFFFLFIFSAASKPKNINQLVVTKNDHEIQNGKNMGRFVG
jgi:hypothetical protein